MQYRPTPAQYGQPDVLTLASGTWLAAGIVLLGLTPLPLHDASLGWSPAFWLLLAPVLVLCARRLSAQRRPTRGPRLASGERATGTRRRSSAARLITPMREHGERRRRAGRAPAVRGSRCEKSGHGALGHGWQL